MYGFVLSDSNRMETINGEREYSLIIGYSRDKEGKNLPAIAGHKWSFGAPIVESNIKDEFVDAVNKNGFFAGTVAWDSEQEKKMQERKENQATGILQGTTKTEPVAPAGNLAEKFADKIWARLKK